MDLRNYGHRAALLALAVIVPSGLVWGQQPPIPEKPSVAPQIELDGEGVVTLEGHAPELVLPNGVRSSRSRINLTDSALLLGAAERLFHRGGIGSVVLGTTTVGEKEVINGTNLFVHQLFLDYQTRPLEAYLGRTNTATFVVNFPTVRGDDLNEFVNVLNPFSSGENVEEHRYGNVAALTFNRKLRYFINVHGQHLIATAPSVLGETGINSVGVNFQYQGPPTLEAVVRVPTWGFGYERQSIASRNGGANNVLYGGVIYNLNPDPVDRVDLRVQEIYSTGNDVNAFAGVTDTFRAAANTTAASVRWLHSPFGKPAYELALTAGHKSYQHVERANTYALALTGVKRLGDGFDVVLQYTYQHRNPAYAAVYSGVHDEQSIQLGFVFNFTNIFNQHLGPRRSLLNLQHQYIPE